MSRFLSRGNLRRGILATHSSLDFDFNINWDLTLHFDTNFVDTTGRTWTQFISGTLSIDTNTKHDGTGSLLCSYTSGSLTTTDDALVLGRKDFIIDMWYYPTQNNQTNILFETLLNNTTNNTNFYMTKIADGTNGILVNNLGTNIISVSNFFTLNTWQRVTLERKSDIWTIYKNGNKMGSGTFILNSTSNRMFIGGKGPRTAGANYGANGWIDEFNMKIG